MPNFICKANLIFNLKYLYKGLVPYNWFGYAVLLKDNFINRAVDVQIKFLHLCCGIFAWTLRKLQHWSVSVVTCYKMTWEMKLLLLNVANIHNCRWWYLRSCFKMLTTEIICEWRKIVLSFWFKVLVLILHSDFTRLLSHFVE